MPFLDTEKALAQSRKFGVKPIPALRPLGWLARGWHDMWRCPGASLAHGLAMALAGSLIVLLARHHFWLLAGAFSGFLLVAPILATGLYVISRDLELGRTPSLHTVLHTWWPRDGRLVVFGVLLAFAGTGWVMTSASLITGFSGHAIREPIDFVRHVVLNEDSHLFEAWLALGALLAAPVFASTLVAVPLLLDRDIGVLGAVFTSWRVVMEYPAPVALWAAIIMLLTLLGMATFMVGLVLIVPLLGHASWHAYRDLVSVHD
ncbi:DUF2189 domain-containing protein [Paucibacter sp. DJ2R-2]|uniref:DUF2189 domain-containing protein n=1 Tax=Paucibacter sp. DJ2R-2 TaxID=2893558 RepID=UPI0021E3C438|nr:DUF2189 domain-containing protein [Paucibacter sp. DJ2R-2]MCV2423134.1 DUF2189 domain-containing protein [Paucibacter sp. DJ4R-1]MCV2440590.1 DUF2189 domain-containing protein [Paucibacter sp. DJ2R-2]